MNKPHHGIMGLVAALLGLANTPSGDEAKLTESRLRLANEIDHVSARKRSRKNPLRGTTYARIFGVPKHV